MSDKNSLAEERTDLAEDRTALANERTFAGWMRTGMAALVVALALRAVFEPFEPTWVPKLAASIFILASVVMTWTARQNACKTLARLDSHETEPHSRFWITAVSSILTVGALATGGILWLL